MNTREFIIGHYSEIDFDGKPQLPRVNAYHKSQGFPKSSLGYWCGYHFFIGEDGTKVQTRGLDERGAHAVNCGCKTDQSGASFNTLNYRAIGICLAGDFRNHPPNQIQIDVLYDLIQEIQQAYGSRFLLHREVKNTACPGIDYRPLLEEAHKRWLAKDLVRKQDALRWATGSRRTMLERAIARILKLLSPTP